MLMIIPRLRAAMWGTTAFDVRTIEKTLVSYSCNHEFMGISMIAPKFEVLWRGMLISEKTQS